MRISYAQNFEDVMLMRAFREVERGVYVDVGAHEPVRDSVSLAFYEKGWRGVHVEPVPEFAAMLEEARPDERVIRAVIRGSRDPLMFYSIADTGLSTGDPAIAAEHLKAGFGVTPILVESMPLSDVLDSVEADQIHWLKVDVEGMERAVLESWGASPVRPLIVVVESTRPLSTEPTHHEWEPILLERGYEFVYFDGLNRFYIRSDRPDLKSAFALPPNFFDNISITEHSNFAGELVARLRRSDNELQNTAKVLAHFQTHSAQVENEREAARTERDNIIADRDNIIADRDNIIADRDNIITKLDALSIAHEGLIAAHKTLAGQHDDLVRTSQNQNRKLEEARRDNNDLRDQLTFAGDQLGAAMQRNHQLELSLVEIRASTSWKLTRPVRLASRIVRFGRRGAAAWLLLKPGSRPRRLVRKLLGRPEAVQPPPPDSDRQTYYVLVGHTVDCSTNTGVQRVVRGLCDALLKAGRHVRFVQWDNALSACVLIDEEQRQRLGQWNGPAAEAGEAGLYPPKGKARTPVQPRPDDWLLSPEIPHMSFGETPVTARIIQWARDAGTKAGFVFYDAIPLQRPEFTSMAGVHAQYMRELRMADAVWPISRWSAEDLVSFWGAGQDTDNSYLPTIHPIHLPADFGHPRVSEIRPAEKLILSVGTVEPRKNQIAVIRAFQAILDERPDCGWKLILAGNLHPDVAQEVRAATVSHPAIEFLGHVSDADLAGLYDRCAFTVFASVSEGYGLPILESVWHAKPCLCADFGAMGEVAAAGGCLRTDVRDGAALKASLERLMDDQGLRRSLAQEAVAAPMPSWADYLMEMETSGSGDPRLIYYWVDSTVSYPANSGIQRVARQLARGLIEAGFKLVPVKWGGLEQPFHPVSPEELAFFADWNGPAADQWHPWTPPETHRGGGWFMMTELPLNLSDAEQRLLRETAGKASLRTAAVFYDTIPWKMRDIYPVPFASAHRNYIRQLADYSLVLPISYYSREEMVTVLEEEFGLKREQLGHIMAAPLAGEFREASESPPVVRRKGDAVEILCVGTVEPRKNHERLLDAFERACATSKTALHLTIAGGGHSIDPNLAERVRARVTANPRVVWEEGVNDARIKQLYQQCDFTVYPSVEEGFGLPILESLWYEKPCICANFGSMAEVAEEGGGCVTVDVRDADIMAAAIVDLANSRTRLKALAAEAKARQFLSWDDYAEVVAERMDLWRNPAAEAVRLRREAMGLAKRPLLSVCISTYNRALWLSTALSNIIRLHPLPIEGVEFVICDNASTDETPQVVKPYLGRPDFAYRRNPVNVGMLGNLHETARAASGEYIWILGDDDLVKPGAIERVQKAIADHPGVALVYLNYAFTRIDDARTVTDFDRFFAEATPIVPPEGDLKGPVRTICARNENFFTAIYTLVFRRDHGLKAYAQDTSGRPFSTMLTCIPTTHYVLNNMMEEPGVWIGEPQVVVNMNVSWMRYAPLWILERIPEVYEVAQAKGVAPEDMDRWRRHTLPGVEHFFGEIFANDPLDNAAYLSPARLVRRFSSLPEFQAHRAKMLEIYMRAHEQGHPAAAESPASVFGLQADLHPV